MPAVEEELFLTTSDKHHRLVVTGIGAVTPLGGTIVESYEGVRQGKNAVRRFTPQPYEHVTYEVAGQMGRGRNRRDVYDRKTEIRDRWDVSPVKIGAPVVAEVDATFSRSDMRQTSRATRLSELSFQDAMSHAPHIKEHESFEADLRKGVVMGTSAGGMVEIVEMNRRLEALGMIDRSFTLAPRVMLTDQIASFPGNRHGFKGPNYGISAACAGGAICISEAAHLLNFNHGGRGVIDPESDRARAVDLVAAGSAEAPLTPAVISFFAALTALSRNNENPEGACRPFDTGRDGFVMAEGGAVVFVQTLESAQESGANIYGELVGWCNSSDAKHPTDPDYETVLYNMKEAVARAGITPGELSWIKAHATSTPKGDDNEARAIAELLRIREDSDEVYRTPVSAPKGHVAHCVGAAGAVEAALAIWALSQGEIIANKNLTNAIREDINLIQPIIGPDGNLQYIYKAPMDFILLNSFGFGGLNSSLVLKRWEKGNLLTV